MNVSNVESCGKCRSPMFSVYNHMVCVLVPNVFNTQSCGICVSPKPFTIQSSDMSVDSLCLPCRFIWVRLFSLYNHVVSVLVPNVFNV